ncbi:TPA: hypothetical protein KQG29_003356 [Clostridioides difficile]|nr:hypothetical protein [Clostridioides difficile]
MKTRKSGFISIECIISIAILYVAIYLVSTSLYSCYSFISRNASDREMLSTVKKYIEDEKYRIQNSEDDLIEDETEKSYINGYEISSTVEQLLDYYQCYEINVEIKNKFKKLRFNSYVTRK